MKILFLGSYDSTDIVLAPIKVGKELFKNISIHRLNTIFICYFDNGSKYSRFQKLFGFEKINERVFRSGIFPLLLFVIKYKPNIIQIVTPDVFYLPLFFLKPILKFKVAYLSHSIISYSLKNFLQINCYQKLRFRIIEKIVLKHSDKIQTLSRVESKFLTRFLRVKNEKIKIVDNGVNHYEIRKEYYNSTDTIKIIFVGSINRKEKSFEFLLGALTEIKQQVLLSIFSYEQQKINDIEMPKNVILNLGKPLNEIELRKEFCKNDMLIIPSIHESFGLSLLEGMDTGILFISTDRVGLTERFSESFKRFVIPYGNEEKLKDKILELKNLSNEEKNRIAEENKNFTINFRWDRIAQTYIQQYNILVN